MELLDGKKVKLEQLQSLKEEVLKLGERLGLAVIQIGDDPASNVYVKQKEKMAESLDMYFQHIKLKTDIAQEEVLGLIEQLNLDNKVDGILVQMPIPKQIDANVIQNAIHPLKDVDGLTDINMGMLSHGKNTLVACTPMGIIDLLDYYNINIESKNVVIVGRSALVGRPLASLLVNHNATVTICHSKTRNLREFTSKADILIVAVGSPNLITAEDVKEDAVVIDVGINRMEDGTLCGDVCFEEVQEKVSYITPVPGGVGQMTVLELGKNTHKAHVLIKQQMN